MSAFMIVRVKDDKIRNIYFPTEKFSHLSIAIIMFITKFSPKRIPSCVIQSVFVSKQLIDVLSVKKLFS